MNSVSRRSFLKALGLGGAAVAGSFVLHDPQVISGDLLAPSPEPTIIKATRIPEVIKGCGEAFVTGLEISNNPIWCGTDSRGYAHYEQGLIDIRVELRITGVPDKQLFESVGQRVRLYSVRGERLT